MKLMIVAGMACAMLFGAVHHGRQDAQEMPGPTKEHEWLQQLVGEWTLEGEMLMGPDQPPFKSTGTESVRSLGGFWSVGEIKGTVPTGQAMSGIQSLGYDPDRKKYVGTWIDSLTSLLWRYEGTLDTTGKILTLDCEGPNMMEPGKTSKFRDAIEIKSKDHKVMTSSMLGDDGKWMTFGTTHIKRKT